jgi:hypothetical protein
MVAIDYCDACLGVLIERQCPRCAGDLAAPRYCRTCLHVHGASGSCTLWTPNPNTYRAAA